MYVFKTPVLRCPSSPFFLTLIYHSSFTLECPMEPQRACDGNGSCISSLSAVPIICSGGQLTALFDNNQSSCLRDVMGRWSCRDQVLVNQPSRCLYIHETRTSGPLTSKMRYVIDHCAKLMVPSCHRQRVHYY